MKGMLSDRVEAPFTPDQVMALIDYQCGLGKWKNQPMHEFTCQNRTDGNHGRLNGPGFNGMLIPTVRGWICPFCDYTQNWAHRFMAE